MSAIFSPKDNPDRGGSPFFALLRLVKHCEIILSIYKSSYFYCRLQIIIDSEVTNKNTVKNQNQRS